MQPNTLVMCCKTVFVKHKNPLFPESESAGSCWSHDQMRIYGMCQGCLTEQSGTWIRFLARRVVTEVHPTLKWFWLLTSFYFAQDVLSFMGWVSLRFVHIYRVRARFELLQSEVNARSVLVSCFSSLVILNIGRNPGTSFFSESVNKVFFKQGKFLQAKQNFLMSKAHWVKVIVKAKQSSITFYQQLEW